MSIAVYNHRQKKAALLKIRIMEKTMEKLSHYDFSQIHVMEICKAVKISKVTFFRYFPQKEDVLLYILRMWFLEYTLASEKLGLKGKKGVLHFCKELAKFCDQYPSLYPHLIKHYAESELTIKPISIKKLEKELRFPENPDVANREVPSLEAIIEKHVLEAIFHKEITQTANVEEIVRLMMGVVYGSLLVSKIKNYPLTVLLKRNVEIALDGLS